MARGIMKKLGGALKTIAPIVSFVPGIGQIAGPAMAGLGGIMGAAGRRNFGKGLLEEAPGMAMSGMGLAGGLGAFGPGMAQGGAASPSSGGVGGGSSWGAGNPGPGAVAPPPPPAGVQGGGASSQSNIGAAAGRRLMAARQRLNPGVYEGGSYG